MRRSIFTTREAQNALSISKRRLMALLAEGKLPGSYKLGLIWQIPQSVIKARKREMAKFYAARKRDSTKRNSSSTDSTIPTTQRS